MKKFLVLLLAFCSPVLVAQDTPPESKTFSFETECDRRLTHQEVVAGSNLISWRAEDCPVLPAGNCLSFVSKISVCGGIEDGPWAIKPGDQGTKHGGMYFYTKDRRYPCAWRDGASAHVTAVYQCRK